MTTGLLIAVLSLPVLLTVTIVVVMWRCADQEPATPAERVQRLRAWGQDVDPAPWPEHVSAPNGAVLSATNGVCGGRREKAG
jgi:hypothetical protein